MSNTPHVVHVTVSLAPGGLERLVVDWTNGRNASATGSTSVCCLDEAGELATLLGGDDVTVLGAHRGRRPFDIPAVVRLARLLRSRRETGSESGGVVVHSHNLAAWQYACLATRLVGAPHVHTEHGTNPHFRGLINRLRNRALAQRTQAIVAVSHDTAQALESHQQIDGDALRVIPNGVDVSRCGRFSRDEARQALGLPADLPVIGCVGRLAPIKGCDRLLHAFTALRRTRECALVFIGDGKMRRHLEEIVAAKGLGEDVHFAGYCEDAADRLKALDLLVLPSRSEGLPVALLEGMAAGIPVLATAVGEVPEVLEGGLLGGLLPEHETSWPELMATALDAGPDRTEAARRRVREHFSQTATLASYEAIYEELIS